MAVARKNSKKRNAILTVLRNTQTHPNAEWICAQLKAEYPDLSLGTVYRNLNYFKEEGQIVSIGTVNGQERFDGNTDPHSHFICEKCGKIQDILLEPVLDADFLEVVRTVAGDIRGHRHLVYGLCRECSEI